LLFKILVHDLLKYTIVGELRNVTNFHMARNTSTTNSTTGSGDYLPGCIG